MPEPPCSGRHGHARQAELARLRGTGPWETRRVWSMTAARGRTTSSAKSRTACWRSRCSSESSQVHGRRSI